MKNLSGFTLIELLVSVAAMSILLVVGVPNLQDFLKAGQITTVNNELVSAMHVARSNAIQLAGNACVCSSADADSATPSCSGSNNWEEGWISFADVNANTATVCVYEPAANDILLKVWNGVNATAGMTVRSTSATINALDYVRFNSRGIPVSAQRIGLRGMFVICDDRGLKEGTTVLGRGVILSASGSFRTTNDALVIGACL